MIDALEAAETFHQAAELNREDSLRTGSLLEFPNYGQVVMTGDLHGHRRNFAKLKKYCDLDRAGARHVILHEIIHEEMEGLGGHDTSHEVLLEAALWRCDFPDQVHFLQSNHELAQLRDAEISKNGRIVTRDFDDGVRDSYGSATESVLEAIDAFLRSFALAGRSANRVFFSHSLPSPRDLPRFDVGVFEREPTDEDLAERGSAYMLVWGRYQTRDALEQLQGLLGVDVFICGHQPQDMGYDVFHDTMLILSSEHNHGVFLPIDLSKPATMAILTKRIRPFAGVE